MLDLNEKTPSRYNNCFHYVHRESLEIEIDSIIFCSDSNVNDDFNKLLYKVKKTIRNIFCLLVNGYEGCSFDELYIALKKYYHCNLRKFTIWRRFLFLREFNYINSNNYLTMKFYTKFNVKNFIVH